MNVALFGYDCTYFSYFVHLSREMERRGHRFFFMHPRNTNTRSLLKRYKIQYHYNPRPDKIDGILSDDEIHSVVEYHARFLSNRYDYEEIYKSLSERAVAQASDFKNFFERNKVDLVLIFNGSFYPSAAASVVAKKMDIGTQYFENGFFPFTTQMDPRGVNFNSSTGQLDENFFRKVKLDDEKLDIMRRTYLKQLPPPYPLNEEYRIDSLTKFYNKFIATKYRGFSLSCIFPPWLRKMLAMKMPGERPPLPPLKEQPEDIPEKPYIFVPLQVHDDSQILNLSPYIKNMQQFIDVVYQTAREVFGEKMDIVVKEHPVDVWRGYDYPEVRAKYPDIYWFRKFDIKRIIANSRFIVTVNSTVGLESLIFHKPVVVLGKAIYGKSGISIPVNDIEDLKGAFESAHSEEIEKILVDKFLYYLRYYHMLDGSYKYFDDSSMSCTVQRIEREFADKMWTKSPEEIAKFRLRNVKL